VETDEAPPGTQAASDRLIASLRARPPWQHPNDSPEFLETHISWVILSGPYAYKIKKPVDYGFVDFTTLEKRRYFVNEELRLNKRLAADWYEAVVPLYGTPDVPTLIPFGPPIEYAVKIRRFPQSSLMSNLIGEGRITPEITLRLADVVAAFHDDRLTESAPKTSVFATYDAMTAPARRNFSHIATLLEETGSRERVMALAKRESAAFKQRRPFFDRRGIGGMVRELHGDMHLGNMALVDDEIVIFDCLEFNPTLRWIDTMSEVAFLVMDFYARERPDLGRLFLDRYLDRTGDYAGVALLRRYLSYRALVRAKVALLRVSSDDAFSDQARAWRSFERHLGLAEELSIPPSPPRLVLTHGVAGSGKTTFTGKLLTGGDAIRIRSDVERQRLFGKAPSEIRYSESANKAVYERLREAAAAALEGGYHAIVDAAFLQRDQRRPFFALAREKRAEVILLDFVEDRPEILKQRLAGRRLDASEATFDVAMEQMAYRDPFARDEARRAVTVLADTDPCDIIGRLNGPPRPY
jgi:aminoglycoside phosphotransferase family enzyme/predicted kinase